MTYAALCQQIDALYASAEREQLFGAIRRLALHRLRDEDAAQDVTIQIWEKLAQYRPRGAFHAWVNTLISHRRSAQRAALANASRLEPVTDLAFAGDLAGERATRPREIEPKAQIIFELIAEGYTQREIAARLGFSYGALRVRCVRWRKQFKESLASA